MLGPEWARGREKLFGLRNWEREFRLGTASGFEGSGLWRGEVGVALGLEVWD